MFNTDDVREFEEAFLLAMAAGYAFDAPARLEAATGAKLIEYSTNGYVVEDRWWNGQDGYSHGTTLLRGNDRVLWGMSYCGPYATATVPCLKLALREQYGQGKFLGGRGPRSFTAGEYIYRNMPDGLGLFPKFSGFETVSRVGGARPDGSYRYMGGLLGDYTA
jgi:hypothetical protein